MEQAIPVFAGLYAALVAVCLLYAGYIWTASGQAKHFTQYGIRELLWGTAICAIGVKVFMLIPWHYLERLQ